MDKKLTSVLHDVNIFTGTEIKKPFVGLQHLVEVKYSNNYTAFNINNSLYKIYIEKLYKKSLTEWLNRNK